MKRLLIGFLALYVFNVLAAQDIVLETSVFRLIINDEAVPVSLTIKSNGEEMLALSDKVPMFSVIQERPFNNEIKLENPNTRTEYRANRIRKEGDKLIVGFETAPYEAVVGITKGNGYIIFKLEKFNCDADRVYEGLRMDTPPVAEFRILQLPVKERINFGEWLNVMWDDRAAVCVAACDPYSLIWHRDRQQFRILTADLYSGIKLEGGSAVILAGAGKEDFLNVMDEFEKNLGLPHGVESRRSPMLNRSICWVSSATPQNIDKFIGYAKKSGLKMMLFYYTCFVKGSGYTELGDYTLRDEYPNGYDDIRKMLDKVKAADITPGFHTLQTHIGVKSRYVTPVLDARLNKKRLFTLKKSISSENDISEIFVEENPVDAPMYEGCRVLGFGGEVFSYEGYSTEKPYKFTGVRRSHFNTNRTAHQQGEIGGILDISEFGASTIYINQNTDLQDEVAEKIAAIYNCGFEFCYFDGSEGVNPPCGINVSLSQYRVVSKFDKLPIFTEGAAKSHFGWHLQAGANAFDVFRPEVFKEMIIKFPYTEAARMRKNMTRVDFGWWAIFPETTPEMWNFGNSKAAEMKCPVTVMMDPAAIDKNPHSEELFRVLKKWEEYREKQK